jgi:hypothetical protein
MNIALFIGLVLFGWGTIPTHEANASSTLVALQRGSLVAVIIGSALIACVLS